MVAQVLDPSVVEGARKALARYGWHGATLERIAAEAGLSRMTLHRRGISRAGLLDSLALVLEAEHREALWPALSGPGTGRERLELALEATCEVAEANLELMAALSEREHAAVYHEQRPDLEGVLTREEFTAPLQRLLLDGAADGSLRETDAVETATVIYNLVGITYRHLRQGHGWPARRARAGVLSIALDGISA